MTVAILKLSYSCVGETPVTGGICGSAFFVSRFVALTANHVLSRSNYKPNEGYRYYRYWLVSRTGLLVPLESELLADHPQIDAAVIRFSKPQAAIPILNLSDTPPWVGCAVYSMGHVCGEMPATRAHWQKDGLVIQACDLGHVAADLGGHIRRIVRAQVNANDITMTGVTLLELSFGGVVGMSGGPLLRKATNEVIGLMSIGLPPNSHDKDVLYAVSVEEIRRVAGL